MNPIIVPMTVTMNQAVPMTVAGFEAIEMTTETVIVKPIPSNYGLITYNGSVLTVS